MGGVLRPKPFIKVRRRGGDQQSLHGTVGGDDSGETREHADVLPGVVWAAKNREHEPNVRASWGELDTIWHNHRGHKRLRDARDQGVRKGDPASDDGGALGFAIGETGLDVSSRHPGQARDRVAEVAKQARSIDRIADEEGQFRSEVGRDEHGRRSVGGVGARRGADRPTSDRTARVWNFTVRRGGSPMTAAFVQKPGAASFDPDGSTLSDS
jgi:hypothetical protein